MRPSQLLVLIVVPLIIVSVFLLPRAEFWLSNQQVPSQAIPEATVPTNHPTYLRPLEKPCRINITSTANDDRINVVIIALGDSYNNAITTVKSVLMHYDYRGPMNFYLITEDAARSFPFQNKCCIRFHNVPYDYKLYDDFIAQTGFYSGHYSAKFAMAKLLLSRILPKDATQFLILDSDIVLFKNIREAWDEALSLNRPIVGGCAEDMPRLDHYCPGHTVFCHPTRYCISGFMFFRPTKVGDEIVASAEWWTRVTKQMVEDGKKHNHGFHVGEQDQLNYVAGNYGDALGLFGCEWGCDVGNAVCPDKTCAFAHYIIKQYQKNDQPGMMFRYFWLAYENLDPATLKSDCPAYT